MKKILLISLVTCLFWSSQAQQVLIANNNPGVVAGGHIFTTLANAITAAQSGDVIQVVPSGTTYGNVTVPAGKDGISIFGGGINPDKETNVLSTVGVFTVNSSNVKIGGLRITSDFYVANNVFVENVIIENVFVTGGAYSAINSGTSNNVFYRNSWINGGFYSNNNSTNVVVNNCIFGYVNTAAIVDAYNGIVFNNCLFYGNGSAASFSNLSNANINNSIFYGRHPRGIVSNANSTFNNCLSVGNNDNSFPTATTVNNSITDFTGSVFQDTRIVFGFTWDLDWDVVLDPSATSLINGGNDGTDIGLTGNTIPFNKTLTSLPYIQAIRMPTIIRQGDILNVSFDAKGN